MPVSARPMNRFERVLFKVALALAGLLVLIRIGAVVTVWFLRHSH